MRELLGLTYGIVALACLLACEPDNPVSGDKENTTEHSPFVGTWVEVFDTTGDDTWTGEEKKEYWCGAFGCSAPDTMAFQNDSLMKHHGTGRRQGYYYGDSVLHFYTMPETLSSGVVKASDTMSVPYFFLGKDTLCRCTQEHYDTAYVAPYLRQND